MASAQHPIDLYPTVGFSGRDGGRMPESCDRCLMVPSLPVPMP
jgi:hypothetical protein